MRKKKRIDHLKKNCNYMIEVTEWAFFFTKSPDSVGILK